MMIRVTLKWSIINCVTIVELIMLTPLSTITTALPRSMPVVNRLPLSTQVRGLRVCATRMSASCPKAETMPMRGVQSLRQPLSLVADAGVAWAAERPSASNAAMVSDLTVFSEEKTPACPGLPRPTGADIGSPGSATRNQNVDLNCTPHVRGSLMKPVSLLKSIAPVTRIWLVMLRANTATSYLPLPQS